MDVNAKMSVGSRGSRIAAQRSGALCLVLRLVGDPEKLGHGDLDEAAPARHRLGLRGSACRTASIKAEFARYPKMRFAKVANRLPASGAEIHPRTVLA